MGVPYVANDDDVVATVGGGEDELLVFARAAAGDDGVACISTDLRIRCDALGEDAKLSAVEDNYHGSEHWLGAGWMLIWIALSL